MSMRTILDRGESGAYRVGSDGPKIASTGVPIAAARCMGPVSPVMNSVSRSSTAASTTRSVSAGNSARGHIGRPCGAHCIEHWRSPAEPMSTTEAPRVRASSEPTSAKRAGSHSLIWRPAAG